MPPVFNKEEEIKEYIENIGIEYRYGCFSEKDPQACHLLGEYLDVIKKDYHKAAKIFKSNCDDFNHPRSCHFYGNYAITGKGIDKPNDDVAYSYYLKGCELNVPSSCLNAGLMSVSPGLKREKDYTKGISLLHKSCDLRNVHACYYLSGLFITGSKDKVVEQDMKKAFDYSLKACDLGNIYACMNVSVMYKKGDGVDKSEEMSEKFKKRVDELKEELETSYPMEFQRGS